MPQKKRNKKKRRITNRQAKINLKKQFGKSNRIKPDKNKKISLISMPRTAEFIDPPDGVKMSAVILKLADPLLKKYWNDDKKIEALIALVIFEWNKLMSPIEEQESIEDSILNAIVPPDGNAEDIGSLLYVSNLIAERKKQYFPQIKKFIAEYDLRVANGNITLNITSIPINEKS